MILIPINTYDDIVIGIGGFAAYVGISNVAAPKQGQVVYVSAAAGGVGQLAGQFSKLNNCYVVGSAGTDEKVHFCCGLTWFSIVITFTSLFEKGLT